MSLMLGQLLDVIESDPALQARVRRLLAPASVLPPQTGTAQGPRPEVEWFGESPWGDAAPLPDHIAGPTLGHPPAALPTEASPPSAESKAASVPATPIGEPVATVSTSEASVARSATKPPAVAATSAPARARSASPPAAIAVASPPKAAAPIAKGRDNAEASEWLTPLPPIQIEPFVLRWLPAIPTPLADGAASRANRHALAAALRVPEVHLEHATSRLPVGCGLDLSSALLAKLARVERSPAAVNPARNAPPASLDKLTELAQKGLGAQAHPQPSSSTAVPDSVRILQKLPLALADAAIVADELACNRPHPGLGCDWLRSARSSRVALEELATAYRAAVAIPDLLLGLPIGNQGLGTILQALATVQAWLYGRIARLGGPCPLQLQLYDALSDVAKSRSVYIKRHMRLDDPPSREEFETAERQLSALIDAEEPTSTPRARPAVASAPVEPAPKALSVETQEVARLLAGRTLLLIGGECRSERQETLCRDFGLKELRWLDTREQASTEPLLKAVADPEVSLVLLLIRFSRHSYGDMAEPCRQRGIPLVRIPGGYGTNQLAHQILDQAGERLAALRCE
jgi:hypothetical protein